MITVALVYWTDQTKEPLYPLEWLPRLKRMIQDNLNMPHRIVCLTNAKSVPFEKIELKHDWVGWWSKIELFRPGLFEDEVLYLDLDTVVLGDLGELFYHNKDFVGLKPFNSRRALRENYFGSGIMSWRNESYDPFEYIYDEFDFEADSRRYHGDQDYISAKLAEREFPISHFQDFVSGIYSYKKHILTREVSVDDARIVCFHGEPRPHNMNVDWITGL